MVWKYRIMVFISVVVLETWSWSRGLLEDKFCRSWSSDMESLVSKVKFLVLVSVSDLKSLGPRLEDRQGQAKNFKIVGRRELKKIEENEMESDKYYLLFEIISLQHSKMLRVKVQHCLRIIHCSHDSLIQNKTKSSIFSSDVCCQRVTLTYP